MRAAPYFPIAIVMCFVVYRGVWLRSLLGGSFWSFSLSTRSEEDPNTPKTFVLHRGEVTHAVETLVSDMRGVMKPHTAAKLKVRAFFGLSDSARTHSPAPGAEAQRAQGLCERRWPTRGHTHAHLLPKRDLLEPGESALQCREKTNARLTQRSALVVSHVAQPSHSASTRCEQWQPSGEKKEF